MTSTIRRLNKSHFDPQFASIAMLSLFIAFNVFTVLGLLELFGIAIPKNKMFYISIGFFIWFINHRVLYKKSGKLVSILNSRYPIVKNRLAVTVVIFYVLLTLTSAAIVATMVRELALN